MKGFSFAPFPDGKPAAITLTFDDGIRDQLLLAAPELEKRHWRGTFFICPESAASLAGKRMTRADFAELIRRGHELGNHTMTHCDLEALAKNGEWDRIANEIIRLNEYIRDLSGRDVQSFTAPWGRITPETENMTVQLRLLNTGKRIYAGQRLELAAFRQELEDRTAAGMLSNIMIHGITPADNGWEPFPDMAAFSAMLDAVGSFAGRAWIGPFGTAAAWNCRARHAAVQEIAPGIGLVTQDAEGVKFPGELMLCPDTPEAVWYRNGAIQHGRQKVRPGDVIHLEIH